MGEVISFCDCKNQKSIIKKDYEKNIPIQTLIQPLNEREVSISQRENTKKYNFIITETNKNNLSLISSNYLGEYINKKKTGYGKLIYSNGTIYEGEFKNDKFEGKGKLKNKNFTYIGSFLNGKKNGEGTYYDNIKKSSYKGKWENDLPNGYGIEKYEDGSIYKGNFINGMKNGNGKLILNNKISFYEGEFKNNKLEGNGIFIWNKNKKYIGNWNNNEISGFGILIDNNVKHIGYFDKDVKSGFGASFFTDSDNVILGKWDKNFIEGFCIVFNWKDSNFTNEKILFAEKGIFNKNELSLKEVNNFKNSDEYFQMVKLYNEKFKIENDKEY